MQDFHVDASKLNEEPNQQLATPEETEAQPDLVLTPGGLRPRKFVQAVRLGEAVCATENGIVVIPLTEIDLATIK